MSANTKHKVRFYLFMFVIFPVIAVMLINLIENELLLSVLYIALIIFLPIYSIKLSLLRCEYCKKRLLTGYHGGPTHFFESVLKKGGLSKLW